MFPSHDRGGLEIHGFSLYMKDGKRWLNFPSKEYKDEMGNTKFSPIFWFKEKHHMEAFQEAAKKAIDAWCWENREDDR